MSLSKKIIVLVVLILGGVSLYVLIPEAGEREYKQSDLYSYYMFTDNEIKKAPRISSKYSFSYVAPDGGQREMSIITFIGGDSMILGQYLSSLGFSLYRVQDNGREEIWLNSERDGVVFYLRHDNQLKKISLTKAIV
ncbi:hypothetical protein [Buttiauxella massiliensis]|uniref:hypothetical protein n=1 Tax=Buttiauxella massiliensis TaxID=2831590 RepID=UPI00125EB488|nr:hypothetical protein [Buttiauxella massiliensis]